MSEEVLQPPDCSVQGVLGLVHDQITQLAHLLLVQRVIEHLEANGDKNT